MQEFHALSSSQATDLMEEQSTGGIPAIPQSRQGQIPPLQIILFGSPSGHYVGAGPINRVPTGTPTTEQLASISNTSPLTSAAPSLITALQATMSPETTKRTVVIPGSRKPR